MNKQQAKTIAAVLCRAIDYYHARALINDLPENADASTLANFETHRREAEEDIADALEDFDDDE